MNDELIVICHYSNMILLQKEVVTELKFRMVTVMFRDIAGFTTLSESMNPADLAKLTSACIVAFIYFYLFEDMDVMTTIICKHGGTIDKYVGGILPINIIKIITTLL